ncbi:hypothetical protein [Brevibacillus sp. SYSU BS000544]|uniref:hypothetical protein n=1 Tax=Brevibacillus sp. SYSU BS000544 TaxID=3416443 RepID=UPI003CE47D4A
MDTILYITFGFLDVIAILALIFKLFRFPFWDYFKEFSIIGICLTFISYLLRVQFNIPEIDMVVQFVIFVLFFRYWIKIRLFYSIFLSTLGGISLIVIQLAMISVLLSVNMISIDDTQAIDKIGTYLIQMFSQITSFSISLVLYRFNLGFSFIMSPPHDVDRNVSLQQVNTYLVYSVSIGVIVLAISLYFLLHYLSLLAVVGVVIVLAALLLFYLSHKKDYSRL